MARPTLKNANRPWNLTVEAETKTILTDYAKARGLSASQLIDSLAAAIRTQEVEVQRKADSILQEAVASVVGKSGTRKPAK